MKTFGTSQLFLFFYIFLISTSTAYAYIDPGSGSVIVTTVLGLIAAIGYTCRKYFYKAKRAIFGSKAEDEFTSKAKDEQESRK